jgi:branched-chain amino acid transport system ATP-binding protein
LSARAESDGALLRVEDVHTYYGSIEALKGVSIEVHEGEIVTLIGANGAGKSTTLRSINGLNHPRQGSIHFDGRNITRAAAHDIVRLGISQSPEGRKLFPRMSVLENLEMGAFQRKDRSGIRGDLERVYSLFPRVGERKQQRAGTLSGGEQQMLAVGRALMSAPRLLLVDEVSLGLAPIVVSALFEALERVNREGTAILLVEQFVHLALKHTSRAYVLAKGQVVVEGASSEMLASPELMAAYLGEMEQEESPRPAAATPVAVKTRSARKRRAVPRRGDRTPERPAEG